MTEPIGAIRMSLEEIIVGPTNPDRPFTGQPHTHHGERGKTEVKGIRFRDLADCLAKAWIDAAGHTIGDESRREDLRNRAVNGTLNYNDLYSLECGDIDPIALIQSMVCQVEKAMGIYPNVPSLRFRNDND